MRGSHHRRNADIRRRASHDRGDVAKIGGIDGDNAAGTSASGEFVPTPFLEAIDISDLVKRQRSLRRSMWGLRILSALLLVLALCVIGYPMVLQYQSDVRLAHTTSAARNSSSVRKVISPKFPMGVGQMTSLPAMVPPF